MKYLSIIAFAALVAVIAGSPVPDAVAEPVPDAVAEPVPDAVAEPWRFFDSSASSTPGAYPPGSGKRSIEEVGDLGKRTLIVKREDVIPEALLKRDVGIEKRTESPNNECGPENSDYTCGVSNDGPCCSQHVCLIIRRTEQSETYCCRVIVEQMHGTAGVAA